MSRIGETSGTTKNKIKKENKVSEKRQVYFCKIWTKIIKLRNKDNNTYFDTIVPFFFLAWLFHQERSIHMLISIVATFLSQNETICYTMK